LALFKTKAQLEWLVVGLGNPGSEYADTRHNVGWMAVDALAGDWQTGNWRLRSDALLAEKTVQVAGRTSTASVALAKPQTYMNSSGRAVKGLMKHYGLTPEQVLVVHDDMDIPEHTLRLKLGGGHGGHNGLRDISASVGEGYMRVRVGVGRPPGSIPPINFVLMRLRGEGLEQLRCDAREAADAVKLVLAEGFVAAQQRYNSKTT